MRAILTRLLQAMLLLLVAACAGIGADPNTLYVQYICTPQGATLYEQPGNKNMGMCTRTVPYPVTDADRARGSVLMKGMTAYWVSGASSSVSNVTASLQNGLRQEFRFERPRNLPGYDVDANYALNLEKNQLLRAQTEAAQVAAAASVVTAINSSTPPSAPQPRIGAHCTTNTIGNTAYTNCY